MDEQPGGASGVLAFTLLLLGWGRRLLSLAAAALAAVVAQVLIWSAVWGRMAPLLAIGAFPYLAPGRPPAGFHRATGSASARSGASLVTAAGRHLALQGAGPLGAGLFWQGWPWGLLPALAGCRSGWAATGRPQRRQLRGPALSGTDKPGPAADGPGDLSGRLDLRGS